MPALGSKIPLPRHPLRWLATKPHAYEIAISLLLVPGGVANALRAFWSSNHEEFAGYLWLATAIGVATCSVAKIAAQYREVWTNESPADLEGCLHVLHAALTAPYEGDSPRVRLTIFVPTDAATMLSQVVAYVGEQSDKMKVGRKWHVGSGIIGKAFRERTAQVGERLNLDETAFIAELQRDWGFSEVDAKEVDPYARAWLAVPLLEPFDERVYGVVFLDSTTPQFWTDERQRLVFAACGGIANFVTRRYK